MLMGHCLMIMLVVVDVLAVNMDMRMGMGVRMFMGMDSIPMAVLMDVSVTMLVGVLQLNCVLNHKICADNHDRQGNIELYCGSFTQNQHAESNA